jgi:hypothetical protein
MIHRITWAVNISCSTSAPRCPRGWTAGTMIGWYEEHDRGEVLAAMGKNIPISPAPSGGVL